MRIIVGITGGVAAYKAVALIRLLANAGHDVKVIPTANALRFVGATTLEAISHNSVDPDLYTDVADVKHIELGKSADLVIVAPATASFLARTAAGIADDLLSNVILATGAPVVVAPAMHTEMWENPATVANVQTLRERGLVIIEPAVGKLTGEDVGAGRLPEPESIMQQALAAVGIKDLLGVKVLVTAGGTREPIDPVRFIGNRSSGKQGIAFANAAFQRGASVTLIAANTDLSAPYPIVHVETASELSQAVNARLQSTDVLVMAAAVSDFVPVQASQTKIKKSETGSSFDLVLSETQDILKAATDVMHERSATVVVGFAAETISSTTDLAVAAASKLSKKGCDFLVANDVTAGAVFGEESNRIILVSHSDDVQEFAGSKLEVANFVLDEVAKQLTANESV